MRQLTKEQWLEQLKRDWLGYRLAIFVKYSCGTVDSEALTDRFWEAVVQHRRVEHW